MFHSSVSRRGVLGAGVGVLASAAGSLALAATPGERKLVLVILRGALDGLSAVPPVADPHYQRLRGRLAIAPPGADGGAVPLTEGFGLHPSLKGLAAAWGQGRLAVLHAAASPYRDRSHFDGQDVLESGAGGVFLAEDGWLNRALAALPRPAGAVAIAPTVPLVLRGAAPASNWAPSFAPAAYEDTLARLADLYAGDPLLSAPLAQAVATAAVVGEAGMEGAAGGRRNRLGPNAYRPLAEAAARLLAAPDGPAAAVLAFEGWDTHVNQGAATGQLAQRLAGLDAALTALQTGLAAHWQSTVVIVATEFGRTAAANGAGGTDHGTGSAAFLLGGAVKGGRMLGDWPGLAPGALYEGRDLAPANDLRALFMGVLAEHWGVERRRLQQTVFPGAGGVAPLSGLLIA